MLSWAGGGGGTSGGSSHALRQSSLAAEWSPVLSIPDVTFINLQYKDYEDDIATVQDELGVTVHNFDDLDQFNNVDDVVALCAALDMAVTTKVTPMSSKSIPYHITKY